MQREVVMIKDQTTAKIENVLDKNGDLDRNTLHQGKPIIKGEKYIITKWFN